MYFYSTNKHPGSQRTCGGRCGWPGCGKTLPSWRLAAPLVFDLPEGEQLGRFCERSCMVVSGAGFQQGFGTER